MSVTSALDFLEITAFRGSSGTFTLPFQKNRKLTLVYGENGTGKTTICDALEFLALERVSSLDNYGLGKGLHKFWPSAGKTLSDITVTLNTASGACVGKVIGTGVLVSPTSVRPRIELLRRQQILNLIQAQPKERYDAIKRFIDIAEFEASEDTLRQQVKSLTEERGSAGQAENQSLEELQGFYEAAGVKDGLHAPDWAKKRLAEPAENFDPDILAIGKLRSALSTVKSVLEKLPARQQAVTDAELALQNAQNYLADSAAAASKSAGETLAILEAGKQYLHDHPDPEDCPLCLSNENIGTLAADIDARLASLGQLRSASSQQQKCATALEQARNALSLVDTEYEAAAQAFTSARDGHGWKSSVELPAEAPPKSIAEAQAWIVAHEAAAESWAVVEASWRDDRKFAASLNSASDRYDQNTARRAELDTLVPLLETALKTCIEQRQAFTNKIIGDIADEVGKLYELVHPGEGLDKIALPLDPKKRASIELETKFSGQDVPPQAYFSQSHLDTLGLCVFLALALRENPAETVLILDDVLGSVDEPHVERVVEMIYGVSEKFRHTILTTHYRPWREKFRWGMLKPDQVCQFAELKPWTLADGMALTGSVPEIERLKTLLGDPTPDVQSICAKAGVILEAILDFLTLKYGCAVPRRPAGTYTLGDLLPAINGKLLAALKVETIDHKAGPPPAITATELKPILDQISAIAQARNVMGAHFNQLAFDLYPADGVKFAQLVEQLADALLCAEHGWPGKDKSGSYWSNGGDTRRLHPLKKPG